MEEYTELDIFMEKAEPVLIELKSYFMAHPLFSPMNKEVIEGSEGDNVSFSKYCHKTRDGDITEPVPKNKDSDRRRKYIYTIRMRESEIDLAVALQCACMLGGMVKEAARGSTRFTCNPMFKLFPEDMLWDINGYNFRVCVFRESDEYSFRIDFSPVFVE